MRVADARVRQWSERFRKHPLASKVVAGLQKRSIEIWQRTFNLLQRESPEYRSSVDEEFTKESRSHCRELLSTIIAVAAGQAGRGDEDPFGFVRAHAEWRARHHVPLTASLQAYRLAHKTYWEISREALLQHAEREEALLSLTMLSDFWLELFDHVGAVLAEAHAVEERLSVAQNTEAYTGLIDGLLRGVEIRDTQARRLSALCGILPGAPMAVAVARQLPSSDGKQMDLEVALRSFVRLVEQAVPSAVFGRLVDIRNDEVIVILCSHADTARGFVKALRRQGFGRRAKNGLTAGVGVSLDATEVARLPESLEEARLALEFATPAQPLLHFADIDLPEFLIRRADKTALRLIPAAARHLAPGNGSPAGELSRTLHAFADCSLNVKQTARRLGVHANTVYFRLNRINKLTGIDPRTFSGASLLLTALRLMDTHAKR
ncbi:MAG TPA: helix-turn-helix domain-containing protein [Bryobacteraceae bacterium]|nr:helix-turn-helix domain-containing protein [Bryobacteraceae bacterium]